MVGERVGGLGACFPPPFFPLGGGVVLGVGVGVVAVGGDADEEEDGDDAASFPGGAEEEGLT